MQPVVSRAKSRYNDGRVGPATTFGTDYEGGLNSHSKTKSGIVNVSQELGPIYDSKEDPIPKIKNTKLATAKQNNTVIQMSGESFGGLNPLNRSSGHQIMNKNTRNQPHRDQIAENFLEDEDEMQESGEINPAMFR